MYDLRQFRSILYTVLTFSVLGYGIALESPGHLLIGLVLVLLNGWMTQNGRVVIIPKYIASALALVTGAWSVLGLMSGTMSPLMSVSQWLFFLMLIILWGRHDNRAYAQMLLMSLVLMVAGAINTANFFYGMVLIAYMFLSLYCCLLFHLKVENDHAMKVFQIPREQLELGNSKAERQLFNRSMRRLTTLVSAVAMTLALLVFLFFPRATSPTFMMRLQAVQQAPLTGFSERVSFEQVARITQNNDIVAHVSLSRGGQAYRPGELYLRGTTLDVYTGGRSTRAGHNWQWLRGVQAWESGQMQRLRAGEGRQLEEPAADQIRQTVLLKPSGTATLFALDGITWLQSDRDLDLHYFSEDGTVRMTDVPRAQLQYEALSSGAPPAPLAEAPPANFRAREMFRTMNGFMPMESVIDPQIAAYVRQPEVSGTDGEVPLHEKRGTARKPSELDAVIAENIQRHLQSEFKYTLDLSDTSRRRDQDPIARFLDDYKRGHCEYFAGAMTLMCQSLGMRARMVIGFRVGAEDFNQLGGYFVVRQSHAHAWVEVLTPEGWQQYDPTAGEYYIARGKPGLFRQIGDFFDYLQYKWATSVVTYSNENRVNVWQKVEYGFSRSVTGGTSLMAKIRAFLRSDKAYLLSSRLIVVAIAASLVALVVAVLIFVLEKRKLYRRAERIGLSSLPGDQQLRLARQLAFYDELLQMLARQRLYRPPNMTHREFTRSLSFLPTDTYKHICELTDVFYGVRYGNEQLEPAQRRRLSIMIAHVADSLSGRRAARTAAP